MSAITFRSDTITLAGNLFLPPALKPLAFLFIQGWKGSQNTDAAQALVAKGYAALTYDMRGNGESEGDLAQFSRVDFMQDAEVAYDFLRQQVGPEVKIGVVGSSFGSYTALFLSQRRQVYCMSLRVPANYPDEGFDAPQLTQFVRTELETWREQKLAYNQNRALQALHDFTGKVQIIEAGADKEVAHQTVINYVQAAKDATQVSYTVMKHAPHGLVSPELQAEYQTLLQDWIATL